MPTSSLNCMPASSQNYVCACIFADYVPTSSLNYVPTSSLNYVPPTSSPEPCGCIFAELCACIFTNYVPTSSLNYVPTSSLTMCPRLFFIPERGTPFRLFPTQKISFMVGLNSPWGPIFGVPRQKETPPKKNSTFFQWEI